MRIESRITLIPLSDIRLNDTARQRRVEPPSATSCFDLALSIATTGLLQTIGVSDENILLFGERRFTAFRLLSGQHAGLSPEQSAELAGAAATCAGASSYDKWTKIPARIVKGASALQASAVQFIENVARTDLPLQDRQLAAWEIHKACVVAAAERNKALAPDAPPERWSDNQTATLLGLSRNYFSELIAPHRAIENAPAALRPKLQAVIDASSSNKSARNAVAAVLERHGESQGLCVDLSAARTVARPIMEQPTLATPILCADFTKWAPEYQGEPFNFIQCDFPYGIDYNSGTGMSTNAATATVGDYDDNAEVYWALLRALTENRDRLVAPSAHILFWFSQNWRRETEDFFAREWPEAVVSKFLLVWGCTDNSGLMPTPKEGRRNYETAFQITIGNRPLVGPKAMFFGHPRNESKVHRSQKHLAVLQHFMSMYVDESSRVLDPTCGSATSLVAAKRLGAKHLLGLEIDPEMAAAAAKFFAENAQ